MTNGKTEQVSLLPLLLIGAVIYWFATQSGSKPADPVTPQPPAPVVVQPVEADYWEALAVTVETKAFGGELQQNTDYLLKIVDVLKVSQRVTDDSRVSDWKAKSIAITDANRAEIAAKLRGKK